MLTHVWRPPLSAPLHVPLNHRSRSSNYDNRNRRLIITALSKQGERFFSSLIATATAGEGDDSAANRLIKKFVAASPKSIALEALSSLLSPDSSHLRISRHALPLYWKIAEASWFEWNPKLTANLAAFLDKRGKCSESEALISETIAKLQSKEREITLFYCELVDCHSNHDSIRGFDCSLARLSELVSSSRSVFVKKQGYKAMASGLAEMGRMKEAEDLVDEMRVKGIKPSQFEFRCILYGYGKSGLFADMLRIVEKMERQGIEIDTVASNMILSSYGAHSALPEIVTWLQKMKALQIPYSIRTWNSALNSCPTIMSMLQNSSSGNSESYPVSIQELVKNVTETEAMLVEELVASDVLNDAMTWDAPEAKLDLHGMHLGSAYVMMLHWMEEMRNIFRSGSIVIPAEVVVVCGSGKHSSVRGESPVKRLVKDIVVKTGIPLRRDRKNTGCFIAKGKVVKEWLCLASKETI
ncbi:Pentatricopeptide repeat-containing protein At2g17033 [Linum perenne]